MVQFFTTELLETDSPPQNGMMNTSKGQQRCENNNNNPSAHPPKEDKRTLARRLRTAYVDLLHNWFIRVSSIVVLPATIFCNLLPTQ
jgi:hypothetical protein